MFFIEHFTKARSFHQSIFYYHYSTTVLHRIFQSSPEDIPQLLNEIQWQSPVHLSSGHWKCNNHILPYALLLERNNHLAWYALKATAQWYFATALPFPLAHRSNYQHEGRLEAALNDLAGRQKGYFCCHRSLYSADFSHWTETPKSFHRRQLHQGQEFLLQSKILKVIKGLNTDVQLYHK